MTDEKTKPESKPKTVQCPTCNGRKVRAVGTDDVPCSTCDGTGKVPK